MENKTLALRRTVDSIDRNSELTQYEDELVKQHSSNKYGSHKTLAARFPSIGPTCKLWRNGRGVNASRDSCRSNRCWRDKC